MKLDARSVKVSRVASGLVAFFQWIFLLTPERHSAHVPKPNIRIETFRIWFETQEWARRFLKCYSFMSTSSMVP